VATAHIDTLLLLLLRRTNRRKRVPVILRFTRKLTGSLLLRVSFATIFLLPLFFCTTLHNTYEFMARQSTEPQVSLGEEEEGRKP
jgi:hypothetical protein